MHGRCLVAAARQLNHVHGQLIEQQHHLFGIGFGKTAALKIRRVEFDRHAETRRDPRTHGLDHLQQQTGAICQRTAPAIGALIAQWREKLADQITVRRVNLHAIEADLFGELGRPGKALN